MPTDDQTPQSGAAAPAPSTTRADHPLAAVAVVLLVGLGIAMSFWRARIWSGGAFTAEVLGYAIGSLLIPAAVAYAIAGRRKVRNAFRFSLWFFGFCLLLLITGISDRPPDPKTTAVRLLREAAGRAPVSSSSTQLESLMRTSMSMMLDFRRAHDSEVAKYSRDLAKLYTAESFSSVASMKRTGEAVSDVLSADQKLDEELANWPDIARQEAAKTPLSEREQAEFVQGATKGVANSKVLSARKDATRVEAEWAAATLELYGFAQHNSRYIVVSDPKIIIANAAIRTRFNELLSKSKEFRKNLRESNERLRQAQAEVSREYGVTAKDFGFPDK